MSDVMEKPRTNAGPDVQVAEAGNTSKNTAHPAISERWVHFAGRDINLSEIGAGSDNPRYEVLVYGWALGRESLRARLDRLTWERDLFYFLACNPGKNQNDFNRAITNDLWRQGVAA